MLRLATDFDQECYRHQVYIALVFELDLLPIPFLNLEQCLNTFGQQSTEPIMLVFFNGKKW